MTMILWLCSALLLVERLGKLLLVMRFFRLPIPPTSEPAPSVTILQPILSGDPTLATCLEHNVCVAASVGESTAQLDFLWLVDEDDNTGQAICRNLIVRYPSVSIQLQLLPPASQGHNPKTVKLRAALPHATGDVICVLDDDTMLPSDGLATALPYLEEPQVGLVFGLPYQVDFSNLWSRLIAYFVNSNSLLTYIPYLALSEPFTINGMFYLMQRRTLDQVGGFAGLELILADDFAVAQRFRRAGYRLVQSPLCHAVSNHVVNFGAYWQLMTRWLIFPRESLMRYLKPSELLLLYAFTLIPTFAPLLLMITAVALQSWPWAVLGITYLLVGYLSFFWTDRVYLCAASPLRWSWLLPITQLLLPLQLLAALLLPQRINWRGHVMKVERGGGFRFVRRRGE